MERKVCHSNTKGRNTMKFIKGILDGVYIIEYDPIKDERGCLSRVFCEDEFKSHGLDPHISQCSISYNKKKGTFRGMHYQSFPHEENKIITCTKGMIFDVILDLRENSKTYGKWETHCLSESSVYSLYIPKGCAHGFQTLVDNTIVHYAMSEPYYKKQSVSVLYSDFNIELPLPVTNISEKDNE